MNPYVITVPSALRLSNRGIEDYDSLLSLFRWDVDATSVVVDFQNCHQANYQALSLFVLYFWWLRVKGIYVECVFSRSGDVDQMWRRIGGGGWYRVLQNRDMNFQGNKYKPLFAIRNHVDFTEALKKTEAYTQDFNIEYEKTLRYVVSELLYNTMEHGRNENMPSLIQFNYYRERQCIGLVIGDMGIGIRSHLMQAYHDLTDDVAAITHALKPKVSGTFVSKMPYEGQNNAGMGLYLSSNIIRRLNADMYIISGNGLVHITPTDQTARTMANAWPGTLVFVTIRIRDEEQINLQAMMSEFRSSARREIDERDEVARDAVHTLFIQNYFGKYAEDKEAAIKYRNRELMSAVEQGKDIMLDFHDVKSAPHSFLNALLSSVIHAYGMLSYKKIKIRNALPEIRETIDFILDENTK